MKLKLIKTLINKRRRLISQSSTVSRFDFTALYFSISAVAIGCRVRRACGCFKMRFIYVLLLIAVRSQTSESHRILGLFPHPAISHFRAFQPLLRELAKRGHEVVVVSHFPEKNAPKNYRDFVLDQSQVMTGAYSVDEVSCAIIKRPHTSVARSDSWLSIISICSIKKSVMTINVYCTKFMPQFVA